MEARRWLPAYAAIARVLGLNALLDAAAAAVVGLAAIRKTVNEGRLRAILGGKPAVIVGAGPSLERWARAIASGWPPFPRSLIAADDATAALLLRGVVPDVIVTDLDGDLGYIERAARMGSVVVVLAHGDNLATALRAISRLPGLVPTGQVVPLPNSRVYGGFTDGDRAVYLAAAMGATKAILVAMELEGEIGEYSRKNKGGEEWARRKAVKLRIARALLEALAGSGFELVEPEAPDELPGDQRRRQAQERPAHHVEGIVDLYEHPAHGHRGGEGEERPPGYFVPDGEGYGEGPRGVAGGIGVAVDHEYPVGRAGLEGATHREGDLKDPVQDLRQQEGRQEGRGEPPPPDVRVGGVRYRGRPDGLGAPEDPQRVERRPVGGGRGEGDAQLGHELLGDAQGYDQGVERQRRAG